MRKEALRSSWKDWKTEASETKAFHIVILYYEILEKCQNQAEITLKKCQNQGKITLEKCQNWLENTLEKCQNISQNTLEKCHWQA